MKSRIARWILIFLGVLMGALALTLIIAMVAYSPQCVLRLVAWQDSDAFDWQKFPARALTAAPIAHQFGVRPDPRVPTLFADLAGVSDWEAFLEETETQAFIVIQDGEILYEGYFNETQRDSIVTSFSVAKSWASALIGIAVDEGYIASVDDPITEYLPEFGERDSRFSAITLRHVLLKASGLEYEEFRPLFFNSDDPLTTYYPDQRQITLENTRIIDPPGVYFQYNKYHPQILGMVLERTTGMQVTEYLQSRIWDPVGMEYGGSWSLDSRQSGFEKMETGVNARAIDFAKFGQLFLEKGAWNGRQVISREWVEESTQPFSPPDPASYYPEYFENIPGRPYYKYMWWGMDRAGAIMTSPRTAIRASSYMSLPTRIWLSSGMRSTTASHG